MRHPADCFREAECSAIIHALRAASGRIAGNGGAAERLGLKRTTLQNKIRRLGIARGHYQEQPAYGALAGNRTRDLKGRRCTLDVR
ncbi:MAG: hypothetical protein DMG91_16410 [Acidobacteria bacterium]|nr:MAG: hypothetical protein DMG91_16410 [Acidobacteriota bacterium]